jgi:hypothetical protein
MIQLVDGDAQRLVMLSSSSLSVTSFLSGGGALSPLRRTRKKRSETPLSRMIHQTARVNTTNPRLENESVPSLRMNHRNT